MIPLGWVGGLQENSKEDPVTSTLAGERPCGAAVEDTPLVSMQYNHDTQH